MADVDAGPDISKEFTCFMCNGYVIILGSVVVSRGKIELITAVGSYLETIPTDAVVSINDLEPQCSHAVFIVLQERYVMLSHLLRKQQLLTYFKGLDIYREEPRLPPEAIGFPTPEQATIMVTATLSGSEPSPPLEGLTRDQERPPPSLHSLAVSTIKEPNQQKQDNPNLSSWKKSTSSLSNVYSIQPSQLMHSVIQNEPRNVSHDTSAQVRQLRAMFQEHSEERLRSVLASQGYNVHKAITNLLDHEDDG